MTRLKRLTERVWVGAAILVALLALGVLEWSLPEPSSHPGVQWLEHRFTWLSPMTDRMDDPPSREQIVTLPDGWKSRGLPMVGMGRYASTFLVTAETPLDDENPWSLRIDRLCTEHRIRLNGQLLVTTFPERHTPGQMEPALIDVPTRLLRPGRNELILDVSCSIQGGLSQPALAPKMDLKSDFALKRQLLITLPLALNIGSLGFAIFLINLWWLRREDASIGLLGAVTIVWALRNCSYYMGYDPGWSLSVSSWLHFNAHVLVANLFGFYAQALTGTHLPWFRRWLWTQQLAFPVIATLALAFDPHLDMVRSTLQGALLMSGMVSLSLVARYVWQMQLRSVLGFGMGTLAMSASTFHDFVMIRLLGDPMAAYWATVGFPMVLPGLYMVLAERFADAIREVEQINQTLEERVKARTADLAAANAAKSEFLAAASHDLRQPMVAIALTTGLLKDRLKSPDTVAMVSRLSDAVGSMENLLSRLLDLSRMEAGAVDLHPQRVALQPLLSTIIASEFETARLKGIRLRMHPTMAAVWVDPILLEQILRNLIGNAVRYTEHGGVLVAARRRGSRWLIQVWDTGVGIAQADQKRIFDDFVQLKTPGRTSHGGLGLGLALVQRAARLLNAEVRLRSRLGRGSCFSVTLPMAATPRGHDLRQDDAAPALSPTPLQGRKILLLEDDLAVRQALERRLKAWGAFVTPLSSLSDLDDALQRVHAPDLLLTDYSLGDGTGLQAMQRAQAAWPALGTVIITGDTSPARLHALADCGAPVLHKPFKIDELARALLRQTPLH